MTDYGGSKTPESHVNGKPVSGNPKGSMLVIWHPWPRTHCQFSTVKRDDLMRFGTQRLEKRNAA